MGTHTGRETRANPGGLQSGGEAAQAPWHAGGSAPLSPPEVRLAVAVPAEAHREARLPPRPPDHSCRCRGRVDARSRARGNGLPAKTLPGAGSTQSRGAAPPLCSHSEVPAGWPGRGRRQVVVLENPAAAAICCQKAFRMCQHLARHSTIREQPRHLEDFSAPASSGGPGRAQACPHLLALSLPVSCFPPASLRPPQQGSARIAPRSSRARPRLPRGCHAPALTHAASATASPPAPQEPQGGQEAARLRQLRPGVGAAGTAAAGPTK